MFLCVEQGFVNLIGANDAPTRAVYAEHNGLDGIVLVGPGDDVGISSNRKSRLDEEPTVSLT